MVDDTARIIHVTSIKYDFNMRSLVVYYDNAVTSSGKIYSAMCIYGIRSKCATFASYAVNYNLYAVNCYSRR